MEFCRLNTEFLKPHVGSIIKLAPCYNNFALLYGLQNMS